MSIQRILRRLDHCWMIGQAQVIVSAEVQHLAAAFQLDLGRLGRRDDALSLEQALFADGLEFLGVARLAGVAHWECRGGENAIVGLSGGALKG